MKNKQIVSGLIVSSLFITIFAGKVFAATPPNFPSCLNPQGSLKVKYDNGTHGIVGDTKQYTGSDSVYTVSDNSVLQCFCPTSGEGIQTNWWKTPDMSIKEIQSYQSRGWHLVPDGSKWGLDHAQYLAKNSNYNCIAQEKGYRGQVLALAFTGNISVIYSFAIVGLIFVMGGVLLGQKTNKRS